MLAGPGAEWRSTFPIKYMLIDFDLSVCSKDKKGPGQEFLVDSYQRLRHTSYPPPEVKQSGLLTHMPPTFFKQAICSAKHLW